ncbi:MAG: hypothetical protein U1E83_07380 [Methylotetracoccus sp.]
MRMIIDADIAEFERAMTRGGTGATRYMAHRPSSFGQPRGLNPNPRGLKRRLPGKGRSMGKVAKLLRVHDITKDPLRHTSPGRASNNPGRKGS